MKKLISIALICTLSTQAHAGIWDSITGFFGGSEEVKEAQQAPATEAVTAAVTNNTKKGSLVKTGLQLLPMLTQTLGVTNGQAKGGMGAILQTAQAFLSKTEYGSLLSAIPGAQGLLASAPAITPAKDAGSLKGKLLSGAMDMASKQGGALGQGANLVSQFKSLGLGADMIPKFGEATSTFLNKSDKPEAGNLLNTALSSLGGLKL